MLVLLAACALSPPVDGPAPEPGRFLYEGLDAAHAGSGGLYVDGDGDDTLAYYARAAIGIPGGVPATLDDWQRAFGLGVREEGEDLEAFRDRTGRVVYYNQDELGLGREQACAPDGFVDWDDDGAPFDGERGQACLVTNYGQTFEAPELAMADARAGGPVKNTVAITYRPSRGEGSSVQFWVYGADGALQDYAQLDSFGDRAVPEVCSRCHGGTYETGGVVDGARFLPAHVVRLVTDGEPSTEAAFRELTCTATRSPLADGQRAMIDAEYDGPPCDPATTRVDGPMAGWEDDPEVWTGAVAPFCATCHLALERGVDVSSQAAFATSVSSGAVCAGTMPHAAPTLRRFWTETTPTGASPKSLLLEATGQVDCARQEGCAVRDGRAVDQAASDLRCGEPGSGRTCDVDGADDGLGTCVWDAR